MTFISRLLERSDLSKILIECRELVRTAYRPACRNPVTDEYQYIKEAGEIMKTKVMENALKDGKQSAKMSFYSVPLTQHHIDRNQKWRAIRVHKSSKNK